jgi:hypothetical protein
MSDTFVKSGLREKRADIARQIIEAKRQIDKLHADLFHVDTVLRLYGEEPETIPMKGRIGKLSRYFGRAELSRRCRDALRENGTVKADAIAVQAMRDKGLDPAKDRKLRSDFIRRILVSLHDLRKAGEVEKVGHGRGVIWRLKDQKLSL